MQPEVKQPAFEHVSLEELETVARKIIDRAPAMKIFILHGEMGAGKTTFVKAMGKVLGVTEAISSPTFSIVNEYCTLSGERIYHFDFYRLKYEREAYDIGVEEYFDSGHFCLVEWPEKIPTLLPLQYVEISITPTDVTHRTISFSIHE
jgi:tRNA threonylcarbamoyladenosine biosynthesis protein TsaE